MMATHNVKICLLGFRGLVPLYYRKADAAIVCYDITEMATFRAVRHWVSELVLNGPSSIVLVIAGNKCDLEEERQVPVSEGQEYADSIGALFFETSAKTAVNIDNIFRTLGERISVKHLAESQNTSLLPAEDTEPAPAKCCLK